METWKKILIFFFIAAIIGLIIYFSYASIKNTDDHYGMFKENKSTIEDEK